MARERLGERMSLILDDEVRNQIEAAMTATGEKVAATLLRRAIRIGLPIILNGGESLRLDGQLSDDVGGVAKRLGWDREKVLLEAIRVGLPSAYARNAQLGAIASAAGADQDSEMLRQLHAAYDPDGHPLSQSFIRMRSRVAALELRLADLLEYVPGAAERLAKMERIAKLRAQPGGPGGCMPWGLTNEEIDREIARLEGKPAPGVAKAAPQAPPGRKPGKG